MTVAIVVVAATVDRCQFEAILEKYYAQSKENLKKCQLEQSVLTPINKIISTIECLYFVWKILRIVLNTFVKFGVCANRAFFF